MDHIKIDDGMKNDLIKTAQNLNELFNQYRGSSGADLIAFVVTSDGVRIHMNTNPDESGHYAYKSLRIRQEYTILDDGINRIK